LAGDYLFAWIFKNVTANHPHPIPHILSATLADITDGEVLQMRAVGNLELSLDGYVEIATKKTARLFAASAECGAIAASASAVKRAAVTEFGLAYGIAFQMQDDVLDMIAEQATIGKPVGGDLREKKMTIPVILALEGADREFRSDVERFYTEDDETPERIAGIVRGIGSHGGFEKTRTVIVSYLERAKAALAPLGNVPARAEFVAIADALLKG
jgi:octaprenyl-diphosphate synthase